MHKCSVFVHRKLCRTQIIYGSLCRARIFTENWAGRNSCINGWSQNKNIHESIGYISQLMSENGML